MKVFRNCPNYFYNFLKSDLALLSDILSPRTKIKLEKIHLQKFCEFLRERAVSTLESAEKGALENFEIPDTLQHHMSKFSRVSCGLSSTSVDEDLQGFLENLVKDRVKSKGAVENETKDSQFSYRKLIAFIETSFYPGFCANFDFLVIQFQLLF